jgi:uncharacterized membrane protein
MTPVQARLAATAAVLLGAILGVVAAVSYFDWRAGLAVGSVFLLAGGLSSLRSSSG